MKAMVTSNILLCLFSLTLMAQAEDPPTHLLRVVYIYSVENKEVNWHVSDETRVQAVREVSKTNPRIILSEFKPKDQFHVTVIVPFEKNFEYNVTGDDVRFRSWVDMQRKGYAKIEFKKTTK